MRRKSLALTAATLWLAAIPAAARAQSPQENDLSPPLQDDKNANAAESSYTAGSAAHTQTQTPPADSAHTTSATETNVEDTQNANASSQPSQPRVSINPRGLRISSADGNFAVALHAYAQPYLYVFAGEHTANSPNGFGVRTFRIAIDADVSEYVSFRYGLDVLHGQTRIYDAAATLRPHDALSIRMGQQSAIFGLERTQSPTGTAFLDRSMVAEVAPNRDVGAVVDVRPYRGLQIELGAFNGVDDGAVFSQLQDNTIEFQGRLDISPLELADTDTDVKLAVGAAVTAGNVRGSNADARLVRYRTHGRNAFIDYAPDTYADGLRVRATAYGYLQAGSLFALGEYAQSSVEARSPLHEGTITTTAWNLTAYWAFGGENTFAGVVPARSVGTPRGLGALQLKARAHGLRVEDDADGAFLSAPDATARAISASAGISWWLNTNARISADYNWTTFRDQASRTSADDEHHIAISTTVGF